MIEFINDNLIYIICETNFETFVFIEQILKKFVTTLSYYKRIYNII